MLRVIFQLYEVNLGYRISFGYIILNLNIKLRLIIDSNALLTNIYAKLWVTIYFEDHP